MTRLTLVRIFTGLYTLFIVGVVVSAGMRWNTAAFHWAESLAGDKVWHFTLVGTLAFLLNLSLPSRATGKASRWLQPGTLVMLLVATTEEGSQLLLANRSFDLGDLGCNYLGIVLLGSSAWWFQPRHIPVDAVVSKS